MSSSSRESQWRDALQSATNAVRVEGDNELAHYRKG